MIAEVGGSTAQDQRSPAQVGQQCQLCPEFSAVDGAGATAITTAKRSHVSRVDQYDAATQTATLTKQRQQSEMHTLPHTEFLPELQASPCSFTAATEFPRDVLPATADRQHEPDHFQHDRMRDGGPPSSPPRRLLRRQQRHVHKTCRRFAISATFPVDISFWENMSFESGAGIDSCSPAFRSIPGILQQPLDHFGPFLIGKRQPGQHQQGSCEVRLPLPVFVGINDFWCNIWCNRILLSP